MAGKNKHDSTPWSLLITLLAVLLTFFIVMPVMGFMYVDLYVLRDALAAKHAALTVEIERTRQLRQEMQRERELERKVAGDN